MFFSICALSEIGIDILNRFVFERLLEFPMQILTLGFFPCYGISSAFALVCSAFNASEQTEYPDL